MSGQHTMKHDARKVGVNSVLSRRVLRLAYRGIIRTPASSLLELGVLARIHQKVTATEVKASDGTEVLARLDEFRVAAWLTGGWACDALIGEQTRFHPDLDLIIPKNEKARALSALKDDGFVVYKWHAAGLLEQAVDLIDHRQRRVSLHLVDIDPSGSGAWITSLDHAADAVGLPPGEPFARGTLNRCAVPCTSAWAQLVLHTGYRPDANDWHDIHRLCARFGLPVPSLKDHEGTGVVWPGALEGR
jgi:lincosamide nucleotidyltransferase A/C/D/E